MGPIPAVLAEVIENAGVRLLQRNETTIGPVAVDGRTITLVARTRAVRVGGRDVGALGVRARPTHVEILDADGRHSVVRIRDVQWAAMASIAVAGTGYILAVHALRKARAR